MSFKGFGSISGDPYDRILGQQPHLVQRVAPSGLDIDDTTDCLVFGVPCPITGVHGRCLDIVWGASESATAVQ
jgi:hypothetical protein